MLHDPLYLGCVEWALLLVDKMVFVFNPFDSAVEAANGGALVLFGSFFFRAFVAALGFCGALLGVMVERETLLALSYEDLVSDLAALGV